MQNRNILITQKTNLGYEKGTAEGEGQVRITGLTNCSAVTHWRKRP